MSNQIKKSYEFLVETSLENLSESSAKRLLYKSHINKNGPTKQRVLKFISLTAMSLLFSLNAHADPQKIVSIGADITEIIFALGHGDDVIARDSTSLEPKEARLLDDVGYMRLLNTEGILAKQPTMVITSSDAGPANVFDQIEALNIPVHKINADKSLDGTKSKIAGIGHLLNEEKLTEQLLATYQNALSQIDKTPLDIKALFLLTFDGQKPSAAGLLTAPDSLFNAIGVRNAAAQITKYQPISPESLALMQPDVIVVSKEGMRHLSEDKIWALPGIDKTPAYKNKHLIVVDDASFLGFTLKTPETAMLLKKNLQALKP